MITTWTGLRSLCCGLLAATLLQTAALSREIRVQLSSPALVGTDTVTRVTGRTTVLRQGNSFSSPTTGNVFLLDFNQGFFINNSGPITLDIPVLRFSRGGAQTVIRLYYGRVRFSQRPFLSRPGSLVILDRSGNRVIRATGTEFTVDSNLEENRVRATVHAGSVEAESGGKTVELQSGQGAILVEGTPPLIFHEDYKLRLLNRSIRHRRLNACVLPGNTVSVGSAEIALRDNGCFSIPIPRYRGLTVTVTSAFGVQRNWVVN